MIKQRLISMNTFAFCVGCCRQVACLYTLAMPGPCICLSSSISSMCCVYLSWFMTLHSQESKGEGRLSMCLGKSFFNRFVHQTAVKSLNVLACVESYDDYFVFCLVVGGLFGWVFCQVHILDLQVVPGLLLIPLSKIHLCPRLLGAFSMAQPPK